MTPEYSSQACDPCKVKVVDFYHFKTHSEEVRVNQTSLVTPSKPEVLDIHQEAELFSTVQIVRSFIARHSVTEIKEDETKLVITPKPKIVPAPTTFQESISIKSELVDIKVEPTDIKEDLPFLHFIRSFGRSESGSGEDLTNSSEGSLSRLPAFEESTYFNGDKFVLRSEIPPKKLKESKKRQRKPELWATNIQKKLRCAGQRYRSAKGYIVAARSMAAPCNCRQECGTKVNEKNRLTNFSTYWSLETVEKKRAFISEHIKLERPMRAMKKSRAFSRLILHFLDVINSDGSTDKVKVCKKMFLNTLDISNTVITTTVKLHHQYFEDGDRKCKV